MGAAWIVGAVLVNKIRNNMRWWVFMILGSGVMGCLMPPQIDEAPENSNRPPRIIYQRTRPDALVNGIFEMSTECRSYQFEAWVREPDIGDDNYWRIFLDYTNEANRLESTVNEKIIPLEEANIEYNIRFSVDPNDPRFGAQVTGQHTIELLVADRPFTPESEGLDPVGRTPSDPGLVDTYLWPVFISNSFDPECANPIVP